jgi:conjugal transfer pilin signal peptidase TrbI
MWRRLSAWRCNKGVRLDPERSRFAKRVLRWLPLSLLLIHLLVSAISANYKIGLDLYAMKCLPWRVFLITLRQDGKTEFRSGDFVAFYGDRRIGHGFEGVLMVKQVAGVAGDHLVIRDDIPWLNGRRLRSLDLVKRLGKQDGGFDRDETVPPGHLWVIGTEPRSYDGRYWGFLREQDVIGTARPLF